MARQKHSHGSFSVQAAYSGSRQCFHTFRSIKASGMSSGHPMPYFSLSPAIISGRAPSRRKPYHKLLAKFRQRVWHNLKSSPSVLPNDPVSGCPRRWVDLLVARGLAVWIIAAANATAATRTLSCARYFFHGPPEKRRTA